jgi:hypothetical protein
MIVVARDPDEGTVDRISTALIFIISCSFLLLPILLDSESSIPKSSSFLSFFTLLQCQKLQTVSSFLVCRINNSEANSFS